MKPITTTIDGYTVEYTPSNDNGLTDCHVWVWITGGGTYSASLQVLMDYGAMSNAYDCEHDVPQATIDRIEAWAIRQGWDQ